MRKSFQFALFFAQTFFLRHKRHLGIAGLTGFLLTLLGIQTYPIYKAVFLRTHEHIGLVGRYNEETLPFFIKNQISIGLTSLTTSGEATPAVAYAWETDEAGKTYTFHLHGDLQWHDGTPFRARDISLRLEGTTFTSPNDTTLTVSLNEPYSALPVLLSRPLFKSNLIGLGMYKIIKIIYNGDSITELTLDPQDRTLPTKTYRFYPNSGEAVLGFKLGEVDMLQHLSDISVFESWQNVKTIKQTQYDRYAAIFFNLNDPLFKEKEVRQALAYAIPPLEDKERAFTPISPLSWAYSRKIRLYNYDYDSAQKILEKSPLATSSALITLSTYAPLVESAQIIVDAWKNAGVNAKVKVETIKPGEFQAMLLVQPIPPDPDQYLYWQSTQADTNLSKYANQKIDKLLEDGRQTIDKDERIKIYYDFQRYLVDDVPAIFLFYPTIFSVRRGT